MAAPRWRLGVFDALNILGHKVCGQYGDSGKTSISYRPIVPIFVEINKYV